MGKTKRGEGTKLLAAADEICMRADRSGLPVAVCIASASPHETRLVQSVLDRRFLAALPERLIGDKTYDSDPLDACLAEQGIVLIAPHRKNRKLAPTQDGRVLCRYRHRWKVERLFAWLQQFRRLVVRHGWHEANFPGFVHLACLKILLRQFQHL